MSVCRPVCKVSRCGKEVWHEEDYLCGEHSELWSASPEEARDAISGIETAFMDWLNKIEKEADNYRTAESLTAGAAK